MKKVIVLTITILSLIGLSACGNGEPTEELINNSKDIYEKIYDAGTTLEILGEDLDDYWYIYEYDNHKGPSGSLFYKLPMFESFGYMLNFYEYENKNINKADDDLIKIDSAYSTLIKDNNNSGESKKLKDSISELYNSYVQLFNCIVGDPTKETNIYKAIPIRTNSSSVKDGNYEFWKQEFHDKYSDFSAKLINLNNLLKKYN